MTTAESPPSTGILFALPEESAVFLRQFTGVTPPPYLVSGMGPARSEAAACQLLAEHPDMKRLLIVGFAGGLTVKPGGIIVPVRVIAPNKNLLLPAQALRQELIAGRSEVNSGTLLSVPEVIQTSDEKRECLKKTHADAVDMETYAAADVARKQGIEWAALRVVTDGIDDNLPIDFTALESKAGHVPATSVMLALLKNPFAVFGLIKLGRHSHAAAKVISKALTGYFTNDMGTK